MTEEQAYHLIDFEQMIALGKHHKQQWLLKADLLEETNLNVIFPEEDSWDKIALSLYMKGWRKL